MERGQRKRAFGRLGSLVLAGIVTSVVVAAIAFAASNGSTASKAGPQSPAAGEVKLGDAAAFPMLAYSWGVTNSSSTHTGGGGSTGKAEVQDISITKATDATTVDLLKKVTQGTHIPTAVITVTEAGTSAKMEYALEDVLVVSVSLGKSGGEKGSGTENVTLNFRKVTWTHTNAAGVSTSGSFDVVAGTS